MLFMQPFADTTFLDNLEKKTPKSALEYVCSHSNRCGLQCFNQNTTLAAIVLTPPEKKKTYTELSGSAPQDQSKIIELFKTMGAEGKLALLKKYKYLEQIGKDISHVHPLKLLGVIFSNPSMKPYMKEIYKDSFKWKTFIDGFGIMNGLATNMNRELKQNNLLQHINGFANHVNIPAENLKPFFDRGDWEGLVKYLIYS